MSLNTVKPPTLEQLGEVAAELGFTFAEADLAAHRESLLPAFEAYNLLDQMPDELPPVSYPRLPGRRPPPEENRHGAWYARPRSRVRPPANSRARRSR
jgi:amidase